MVSKQGERTAILKFKNMTIWVGNLTDSYWSTTGFQDVTQKSFAIQLKNKLTRASEVLYKY